MKLCSRCLMPDTRPRIVFTGDICNACLHHESLKTVDWGARKKDFERLVDSKRKHQVYDCIVPFSGGKDSASIAWRLKFTYGLNPLLVCYGQLMWTDVGRRNLDRVAQAGFDIEYFRVNQDVSRKLARRFFIERGHIKQHYDAAVNSVPLIAAINWGIPLVCFAEHGESSYGGLVLSEEHLRRRDLAEVLENQIGDDPQNWAVDNLTEKDVYLYCYPDLVEVERVGVEAVYWSYYHPWDIYENALLMKGTIGFEAAQNGKNGGFGWGKSDGSFEGYDSIDDCADDLYFYVMHEKFGFGRASRMASRLIQGGHMSREEGLELVAKYDGEFPETYLPIVLEYLGMDRTELMSIVQNHRNTQLWGAA